MRIRSALVMVGTAAVLGMAAPATAYAQEGSASGEKSTPTTQHICYGAPADSARGEFGTQHICY